MDGEQDLNGQLFTVGRYLTEEFLKRLQASWRDANTEYRSGMFFLFAKAYKSYQAVELLWNKGFTEDAYALARGIYELSLEATYMSNDAETRSKQFFDHQFRSWFGNLQVMRSIHPDKESELDQAEARGKALAEATNRGELIKDPAAQSARLCKSGGAEILAEALRVCFASSIPSRRSASRQSPIVTMTKSTT